jgi:transposase
MSKAQASRTFSVSLSSVKRYVGQAERGESLAPKKRPGSTPKLNETARKLLEQESSWRMTLPSARLPASGTAATAQRL